MTRRKTLAKLDPKRNQRIHAPGVQHIQGGVKQVAGFRIPDEQDIVAQRRSAAFRAGNQLAVELIHHEVVGVFFGGLAKRMRAAWFPRSTGAGT